MIIYEGTNNLVSGAFLKCFTIVKLGCTGVNNIFLIFALKQRSWVLLRIASEAFVTKTRKISIFFQLKIFFFTALKISTYCIGIFKQYFKIQSLGGASNASVASNFSLCFKLYNTVLYFVDVTIIVHHTQMASV